VHADRSIRQLIHAACRQAAPSAATLDPLSDVSHRFTLIAAMALANAKAPAGTAKRLEALAAAEDMFDTLSDLAHVPARPAPAVERAAKLIVTMLELPEPLIEDPVEDAWRAAGHEATYADGGGGTYFSALQDYIVVHQPAALWRRIAAFTECDLYVLSAPIRRSVDAPLDGTLDAVTCDMLNPALGALIRFASALDVCTRAASALFPFAALSRSV
jgi:hypothetical protein